MLGSFNALSPLQVSATDFRTDTTTDSTTVIVVFVVLAVIIGTLVLINSKKGVGGVKSGGSKGGGKSGGGGSGFSSIFSGFSLLKIARTIGLSQEQTRMLDFIFKTDGVTEPEKSIENPALLDRHFRRAYRIIENSKEADNETQRKFAVLFSTRNLLENCFFGGITSTRQLKDDATLIISSGKNKINVNVLTAKNDCLIIDVPKTVLGSQIKIPKGTKLTVLFFTKNNKGFSFETRVVGFINRNGQPAMQLAHSNQLRFLSQRRFRRKQAAIACSMFLVYVDGSGKKQRMIVDKRRINASITDISVGGCSIKILTPIQVGARFKIEFTQNDASVAALGQVLRSNRTGAGTIIHVRFLRVSQKSMNIINTFVYEYGRE